MWPHPLFDTAYYERTCDDLQENEDPLSHFVLRGEKNGQRPNHYFDCDHYRKAFGRILKEDDHPLNHYLEYGTEPWCQPSMQFGQAFYLTRYPQVVADGSPALIHFLHSGLEQSMQPLPQSPFFDRTAAFDVDEFLTDIRRLADERDYDNEPVVSVIIPAYKSIKYTLRCIHSCLTSSDETSIEIIVADDKSPDDSGQVLVDGLKDTPGIIAYINDENLGFLKSCNSAAERAKGKFIFFLNNDTAVLPGWIDELVATFERNEDAGLVGSKLIYPNGLLQEAGGLIWSEGTCANFGRLDDPRHFDYNYQRDVDYISGAAIAIPTVVWKELGGFSEELAPAYYEDTDFAMKVRESGRRVIYQPASTVVHYEGISSGTDTSSGVKKYQAINEVKFKEKWAKQLASYGEHGQFDTEIVDRKSKAHVLVFDAETPKPDKDSGSITAFFMMQVLSELGYRVTFVPENLLWSDRYSKDLQRLGVRVLHVPYVQNARKWVLDNAEDFDLFILSRASTGGAFFNELKKTVPEKPIVFDTVDIHHLRLERQFELEGDPELRDQAAHYKNLELSVTQQADATIVVSEYEVDYLTNQIGPFPNIVLPLIYAPFERDKGFSERQDIAFVGGYRHPPNIDAVEHLIETIWPLFRELDTGANLHIIGSHMPSSFMSYADEDIRVVGFVEDLEEYLSKIRLTVAPLRYGAGVKGKVGNSLRMGVPVVATNIAAEGMGLKNEQHLLVAPDASGFSQAMSKLYTDETLWERLSNEGKSHVERKFGLESARRTIKQMCETLLTKK